jgi:hypothetical protein
MRACKACGRIYAPSHGSSACAECQTTLTALPLDEVMSLARERQRRLRSDYQRRRAEADPVVAPEPIRQPGAGRQVGSARASRIA